MFSSLTYISIVLKDLHYKYILWNYNYIYIITLYIYFKYFNQFIIRISPF